jgi:hypothetical protein
MVETDVAAELAILRSQLEKLEQQRVERPSPAPMASNSRARWLTDLSDGSRSDPRSDEAAWTVRDVGPDSSATSHVNC